MKHRRKKRHIEEGREHENMLPLSLLFEIQAAQCGKRHHPCGKRGVKSVPDFTVDPSTDLSHYQDHSQGLVAPGGVLWNQPPAYPGVSQFVRPQVIPGPQSALVNPGSRWELANQTPRCAHCQAGYSRPSLSTSPAPGQLLWPQPQDQLLGLWVPRPS